MTDPHSGNQELIKILCVVGYELWKSSLSGSPANHKRFERMDNPAPGDLVLEVTSGAISVLVNKAAPSALGTLIEVKREKYPSDEPWDEVAEGRPVPLEEVVYIRRLDNGGTVRWTNAKFIAVLPVEGWNGQP